MFETPLSLLRDQNAPASVLLAVVIAKYGTECFDWESEILRAEVDDDFGVKLTDLQADKLQAAITILTTDHFESNWHVFNVCVHLLNGEHADFDTLEPVEAEQIAAIMPEVAFLRNDDDGITFSDEVNAYVGLIFSEYGCISAPTIFPTAIMPTGLNFNIQASMLEKNEALSEMYQAKKEQLDNYLTKVRSAYE